MTDLLVLGSGIAGLSAAIRAAERGLDVTVLTKGALANTATSYAQGGVAAALAEPDSPALHRADTLTAGVGLCDDDAVDVLVGEGPDRVRELMALGANFDRAAIDGELELAREGGHSLARVVHAGGDATGAEIERALVAAMQELRVDARERWFTVDLLVEGGAVVGVEAIAPDGSAHRIRARHVLLLPELLLHDLCGVVHAERTSAGTTSLVDLGTGTWSAELIDAIGADPSTPFARPASHSECLAR